MNNFVSRFNKGSNATSSDGQENGSDEYDMNNYDYNKENTTTTANDYNNAEYNTGFENNQYDTQQGNYGVEFNDTDTTVENMSTNKFQTTEFMEPYPDMNDNNDSNHSKNRGKFSNAFHNWIDSYKRAEPPKTRHRKQRSTSPSNNQPTLDENGFPIYSNSGKKDDNKDTQIFTLSDDLEDAAEESILSNDEIQLKKAMKKRHVIMMTLGTGIGTGLLVANAKSLHFAGPAGLVIAYFLVSFVTYFVIQAAGEMAIAYPTLPGSFNTYQSIFISKSFGFATVWLFALQWLTVFPLELITSSLTVKYWNTSINADVFIVIFYIFLLFIHFIGVKAYGEAEFLFNSCKILMILGFIIFSICVNCGGAGVDGYIGGKYWHTPGPFPQTNGEARLKEICYVLINAYFSYGGTELYVLTINEQENPRRATPAAAKTSIYRICVIYLLTMILIGFNVPWDNDQLMGGNTGRDVSPYVLAASIHKVKIVPHFINAVILISVISVANSALYAAPRLFCTLAEQGYAPKFLTYIDREGRPLYALITCCVFGVIGFAACSDKETEVFTWLAAIAGISELFTWSGILISHIRFRKAMKVQNKSLNEVGYLSNCGIWGSYYGIFFNMIVFMAQFWVALSAPNSGGVVSAEGFFESYLGGVVWVFFYFSFMIYKKDWKLLVPLNEIDLDNHRQIYDADFLAQEKLEKEERYRNSSIGKKIMAWLWV